MTNHIITLARTIATAAHQGIYRADGTPYIDHPAAVAHYAATQLGADDYTIALCWVHDVPEDTSYTFDDLIRLGLPSLLMADLDAMTVRPGEPYLHAVSRAAARERSKAGKLADNWHNSSTLTVFSDAERSRRTLKYQEGRRLLTAA